MRYLIAGLTLWLVIVAVLIAFLAWLGDLPNILEVKHEVSEVTSPSRAVQPPPQEF